LSPKHNICKKKKKHKNFKRRKNTSNRESNSEATERVVAFESMYRVEGKAFKLKEWNDHGNSTWKKRD
jgi:hypothetical protein